MSGSFGIWVEAVELVVGGEAIKASPALLEVLRSILPTLLSYGLYLEMCLGVL